MHGINNLYAVVPLVFPVDNAGTVTSDIISMKNWGLAEIYLMTAAAFTKTATVTLHQGASVSSCATALAFDKYYQTGFMLKYTAPSTDVGAAVAETVTGASTAVGTVYRDDGDKVVCYDWNSTAFVDGETITFSGGKTAKASGIRYNEDIMVPTQLALAVNTFTITQVLDVNKIYCIPVSSDMLTVPFDCIELNLTDCDSPSILAAWAILSQPRFIGNPPETAIYN